MDEWLQNDDNIDDAIIHTTTRHDVSLIALITCDNHVIDDVNIQKIDGCPTCVSKQLFFPVVQQCSRGSFILFCQREFSKSELNKPNGEEFAQFRPKFGGYKSAIRSVIKGI